MKINPQLIANGSYSTAEKMIGYWVDNKPIYRKSFSIGSVGTNGNKTIATISNIDTVINILGACYYNGIWTPLPRTHTSNIIYQQQTYIENGTLKVACASSSAIAKGTVTVEYTKTTD